MKQSKSKSKEMDNRRTFSWQENFIRLTKDFEFLLRTSRAMIYLASTKLLFNKI